MIPATHSPRVNTFLARLFSARFSRVFMMTPMRTDQAIPIISPFNIPHRHYNTNQPRLYLTGRRAFSNVILWSALGSGQRRISEILRFAQYGTDIAKQRVSSLTKLFDHVSPFQTITKRAVILPGTNATKHR